MSDSKRNLNKSLFILGFTAALGILGFFFGAFSTKLVFEPRGTFSAKVSQEISEDSTENTVLSLFHDSILSIIQNYYVDVERIGSKELLLMALEELKRGPELDYSFNRKSGELRVIYSGAEMLLKFPEDYTYRNLFKHSILIARFLDSQLPPAKGNGTTSPWYNKGSFLFLNGLLNALDPHSSLLNAEQYKELRQGTEGAFGGLGVVVGMRDNVLTVIKSLSGSPASRAGIKKSDQIISIGKKQTFGSTLDNLVEFMRGAPGSVVDLSLLRKGEESVSKLSLVREVINVNSVEYSIDNVGKHAFLKISIESFSSRTSQEVADVLEKAQHDNKNLAGIILDLRSNPGGLLDQAVKVSDLFLRDGRIVSTSGRRHEIEIATPNIEDNTLPMAVLINGETASASEIVAGALQDNLRAIVIGEPSFGKGSVQTIFELPGDQALKLTIARYYTPLDYSIQNVGIMPNIWLQPIKKGSENHNLLGEYRYKSENFLLNHLSPKENKIFKLPAPKMRKADYHGYYEVDEFMDYFDSDLTKDKIYQFSLKLVAMIAKDKKKVSDEIAGRSSFGMHKNSEFILNQIARFEKPLMSNLQSTHNVNWHKVDPRNSQNDDLEFTLKEQKLSAYHGENKKIEFKLRNKSSKRVSQVSVFIRSFTHSFNTHEVLVGMIEPGEEISQSLEVPIQFAEKTKKVNLYLGVALSGIPANRLSRKLLLLLKKKKRPVLTIDEELSDDGIGAVAGKLEANEKCFIKLSLKNDSETVAKGLGVSLVSLSGTQVGGFGKSVQVGDIGPNDKKEVLIPISAEKRLYLETLTLGLIVKASNLLEPIKTTFDIKSIPTQEKIGIISH